MRSKKLVSGQALQFVAVVGLLASVFGCAHRAQVKSGELPVRRVVVYRNGVAYFERSGQVDSKQVQFRLRKENVGDFLATMAVMERGGHSVRAASFPVSMEDEKQDEIDPRLAQTIASWEGKDHDSRELRKVTLELDGEKHDLTVGYLAETPLWRPSYRLVVGDEGQAVLQAWGIVVNQSGEDWRDVEIALVAGAPIAFESTLGSPVVPRRPIVTDEGEVIAQVPESTTTYQNEPTGEQLEDDVDEEAELMAEEAGSGVEADRAERSLKSSLAESGAPAPGSFAAEEPRAAPRPMAPPVSPLPRNSRNLAQVQIQTGATRYEVPYRVTIPDTSATMVLLVSKKVPGEAVFLYAPDRGVPDSYAHPFRVARFKNASGGMLERGPIAVFEKGAFLGQGVVESLPSAARATVPFALMRSLSIHKEITHDQRGARLYAVADGEMTVERDLATLTAYQLQNGEKKQARVLLRHSRLHGAKLWEPPEDSEEIAEENAVLVPVVVPGYGKASLIVEERLPVRREADFRSMEARTAIRDFLKSSAATEEQRLVLEQILKHAAQLATLDDQERRLVREQRELERSTNETRSSLKAIKENEQARELRAELIERLAEGTKRLDTITKELIELRLRRTEQEVRLKQARQGLVIPPPDRRN